MSAIEVNMMKGTNNMKRIVLAILALITACCLTVNSFAAPMPRTADGVTYNGHDYSCQIRNYSYSVEVNLKSASQNTNPHSTSADVVILVSPNTTYTYTPSASAGSTLSQTYSYSSLVVASRAIFYIENTKVSALYGG